VALLPVVLFSPALAIVLPVTSILVLEVAAVQVVAPQALILDNQIPTSLPMTMLLVIWVLVV